MKVLILVFALLTTGCGAGDVMVAMPDGMPPQPDAILPVLDPALQERVNEAIRSLQSDTCFAQDDTSQCQWADYEIGPSHVNMAKSTGEAVLIIDGFESAFFSGLVRYRNRILGYYQVNGDKIEAQTLLAHLPKRLGDVLVSFAGPEFIPASLLTTVAMAAGFVYRKQRLERLDHGGIVFGYLVDLVPEQPLVLLNLNDLFGIPPAVCQGINSETLAAGTAHFAAVAASLKQVMTDHNVRFINASFGESAPAVAEKWSRTCGSAVPGGQLLEQLLHIYDPVFDVLFNSEGVITANAAANLGSPADFPFDQSIARYSSRVRVGFFSSLRSGIDEVGRGTIHKADQFPVDGDADVYLNWGCEADKDPFTCADPHYYLVGAFGLGSGTLPVMSASFISPLGLARLVNLRYANHSGEPMSNTLIQVLKQELTPSLCGPDGSQPCVYQDPIVHQQLEPYRLHYQ